MLCNKYVIFPKRQRVMSSRVDLRPLKQFAARTLPKGWPLREVLMAIEDHVLASEFVAHVKVWLVLLRKEPRGGAD